MGWVDFVLGNIRAYLNIKNSDSDFVKISIDPNKKKAIIIFLGWKMRISHLKILYSKFPDYHKIVYQLPFTLLSGDFELMKKSWEKLLDSVNKDMKENNVDLVYGISLGTVFATYIANKSKTIKKVILALPIDELASVFWNSFITRLVIKKAKKRGYTQKDMKNILSKYDPVNNLDNLKDKKIKIYIAKLDSIIFPSKSRNLVSKMKALNLNVKLKEVSLVGHYSGGLHSSLFRDWME